MRKLENAIKNFASHINIFVPSSEQERLDEDVLRGKLVFSSFHQAKGLERKAVLVVGFDAGYFKFYNKDRDPYQCANELYVAATRAKERITLFHFNRNEFLGFMSKSLGVDPHGPVRTDFESEVTEEDVVARRNQGREAGGKKIDWQAFRQARSEHDARIFASLHEFCEVDIGGDLLPNETIDETASSGVGPRADEEKRPLTPVTMITKHLPDKVTSEAVVAYVQFEILAAPGEVIDIDYKSKQGDDHFENVAEITGTAVPIYFEYQLKGGKEVSVLKTMHAMRTQLKGGLGGGESTGWLGAGSGGADSVLADILDGYDVDDAFAKLDANVLAMEKDAEKQRKKLAKGAKKFDFSNFPGDGDGVARAKAKGKARSKAKSSKAKGKAKSKCYPKTSKVVVVAEVLEGAPPPDPAASSKPKPKGKAKGRPRKQAGGKQASSSPSASPSAPAPAPGVKKSARLLPACEESSSAASSRPSDVVPADLGMPLPVTSHDLPAALALPPPRKLKKMKPADLLRIANKFCTMNSGMTHKLFQITHFNWLSEQQLLACYNRLVGLGISKQAKFEVLVER